MQQGTQHSHKKKKKDKDGVLVKIQPSRDALQKIKSNSSAVTGRGRLQNPAQNNRGNQNSTDQDKINQMVPEVSS